MKRKEGDIASVPVWFVVLLVAMALPLLFYPYLLAGIGANGIEGVDNDMFRQLIYIMPVYVVVSQCMSYKMYPQWPALAWVLQFLLLAVYAACVLIVL